MISTITWPIMNNHLQITWDPCLLTCMHCIRNIHELCWLDQQWTMICKITWHYMTNYRTNYLTNSVHINFAQFFTQILHNFLHKGFLVPAVMSVGLVGNVLSIRVLRSPNIDMKVERMDILKWGFFCLCGNFWSWDIDKEWLGANLPKIQILFQCLVLMISSSRKLKKL